MTSRRVLVFLLCLLSLTLASCGSKGGGGGNTRMRVFNAIPDATAISVTLDTNAPIVTGLQFQQMTQYLDVSSGSHEFKVSANGGASNVIDTTLSLNSGADFTYVVYGPVSAATAVLFGDTGFTQPNSGNFSVRLINTAAGIGAVDLYLTPAGADLNTTSATIPNVGYGAASAFTAVVNGTYEIRVTAANTKDVIFDTGTVAFSNQTLTDVVVYTKGSSKLAQVALLNIDSTGTGKTYDNLLAAFKVINASSVASPLNVLVDGTLTLSNVPYTGVSNYTTVSAGTRTFTVQATATPGANLITLVNTLAAATDTSIAFSGPAGALVALVLQDNNLPPAVGRARLRFVNTSADFPSLDVYVNFSKQVSSLTTNSASSYSEVTADATTGTSYEFDFNTAGTVTPVLKVPGVSIVAGHTYTIYVVGPAAAPVGVVSKDD